MEDKNVTVSYYIPAELVQRVEEEARRQDRSASWTVKDILGRYFEQRDKAVERKKSTGPLNKRQG